MKSMTSSLLLAVALLLLCGDHGALASPSWLGVSSSKSREADKYRLPDGFLVGAGTSAYQTEGAWDEDGKGVNVFDHYYHSNNFPLNETGDIAANSYRRYDEDFSIAQEMGLNAFRISIMWTRIFPNGTFDYVNPKGVQHYHDVIDSLRSKGLEPLVTMFHFEYPYYYSEKFDGWLSETNQMPAVFEKFADFIFNEYGSKVKYWLTINEAAMYCTLSGDGLPYLPPYNIKGEVLRERCLHNLILAHARAYKLYYDKYHRKYHGLVGFGAGPYFYRPATDSAADLAASEAYNLNGTTGLGASLDPLVFGDYPAVGKGPERPAFTDEEKELLAGRIDFVGINIYFGKNISAKESKPPRSESGNPAGAWVLRAMPAWIAKRYGPQLPILITESGMHGTEIEDWNTRGAYLSAYLRALVAGVHEDGNNIIGYVVWSFLDSFEFEPYSENGGFGLVHVDYESGSLQRTAKRSAELFRRIARSGTVPLVERSSAASSASPSSLAAMLAALLGLLAAGRQ